ncbi:MAG TPA: hypothetical protein VMT23_03045 [Candidatus Binatia bacterium]|nr:hypothetical protein [Candidatus Binatia bacterium]
MDLAKLKSLFLKSLIGCLIAAAGLAVVTVLSGQFTDISEKALWTIVLVAIHCLISFGFIVNNEKQDTFDSLTFFTNSTFMLIVISFITSVLWVWGAVPSDLGARLYALYFVLFFAILHGEILAKTVGKQPSIDRVVYFNYFFMLVVILMLLPIIFLSDSSVLGSFYYRLLAACGIVDATLTLITVIMHNLYIQKHPKVHDDVFNLPKAYDHLTLEQLAAQPHAQTVSAPKQRRGMNIFVLILIILIGIQLAVSLLFAVIGSLNK